MAVKIASFKAILAIRVMLRLNLHLWIFITPLDIIYKYSSAKLLRKMAFQASGFQPFRRLSNKPDIPDTVKIAIMQMST